MHPLHELLVAAAAGRFPAADGAVEVQAPDAAGTHAVVEFTGHAFVLTDRDADELVERGADGFGGVAQPDVVRFLAGSDGRIGSHDVVLVATGGGSGAGSLAERTDLDDHPRVVRSRAHRRGVRVFGDERGVVTLGRGLVDRLEVSFETTGVDRGAAGAGRALLRDALGVVAAGDLVWAQVAPGNAASLRAILAAGFVPIGAETLLHPVR